MCPHLIATLLAVTTLALAADEGALPIRFTVANRADGARRTVARVSVPVPAGAIAAEPCVLVATGGGHSVAAQSHVITRHTDGSVRRMMLSVPLELAANECVRLVCEADLSADDPRPILDGEDPARISTDAFDAVVSRARLQLIDSAGRHLATIEPFGPVPESAPARMTVLEAGAHCVWLRYNMDGEQWAAEADVEISRYGEISLTHRLQAREAGNHWTPDFGFEVTAPERIVLAKNAPDAELALTVDFRGTESMKASAVVTAVPEGVAAEPETIRWTVARGRHTSPAIRLAGAIAGEGQVAIRWRIGPWEGEATVALSQAAD